MAARTLTEIQNAVSRLGKQYGAERIYLFGSYARGDMTATSDIDLRIDKGSIRGFQLAGLLLRHAGDPCELDPNNKFGSAFSGCYSG